MESMKEGASARMSKLMSKHGITLLDNIEESELPAQDTFVGSTFKNSSKDLNH